MPRKILICEEKQSQGQSARQMLQELLPDVELFVADPDTSAEVAANQLKPDLVLLCCAARNGSDGYEQCRRLLKSKNTSTTSVILTGSIFISPSDRIRAFQSGATGIISRPYNEHELRNLISLTLPLKNERDLVSDRNSFQSRMQSAIEISASFRFIFDYSHDPTALLDAFGQIVEANPSTCQMLGMLHKDLIGAPFASLVTSSDRELVLNALDDLSESKIDVIDELQFTSSESSMALEVTSGVLVKGTQPPLSLIHLRDISHQKHVTEALRESRIRAEAVLNTAVDGIITIDERGIIESVNRSAGEMFGYQQKELLGTSVNQLMPAPHQQQHDSYLQKYLQSGEKKIIGIGREIWGKRKNGSVFPIELAVSEVLVGEKRFFTGIVRDLTARKRAEADRDRLAMVVRQITEAVLITNTKGIILYVNPAFEKDTGYSAREALGKSTRLLNSGRHDKRFFSLLWETILNGEVWTGRLVDRRKDGSLFDIHQVISPVIDSTGNVVNFVSVWRDVTHERQLEEQVRQSQKMDAVGRLASGIAHDFNNVLSAIIGYTEILIDKTRNDSELTENVREILSNAERATNLTRQLLTFSRRQTEELQTLSLNEVLHSMHKLLQRTLTNDIELVTLMGDNIGFVRADFGQMEQAVLNLAINARDAMNGRGKLIIETQWETLNPIEVHTKMDAAPGDYVVLSVKDFGQGMSEETLQHIFEPFYTTKKAGKGTGLGLAVVYGIIRQHHGWIEVDSEPGRGTEFRIYLPRLEAKARNKNNSSTKSLEIKGSETVLIVDDDDNVRKSIELMLGSLGYKTISVSSGQEAIEITRENPGGFQIVVCDVIMPQMNGRETIQRIHEIIPDMKALFITGYTSTEGGNSSSGSEEIPVILKPFNREKLAAKIREILDSK